MKVRLWTRRRSKTEVPIDLEVDRVEIDKDEIIFFGIEDKDTQRNMTELVLKHNEYDKKWRVWYCKMVDDTYVPLSFTAIDFSIRRKRST